MRWADDAASYPLKSCSQSTVKPTGRSFLCVTELLHRAQDQYKKVTSFASMIEMRSANPKAKAGACGAANWIHKMKPPTSGEVANAYGDLGRTATLRDVARKAQRHT